MKIIFLKIMALYFFSQTSYAAGEVCLYTSIYNSGEKTWLLFNTIEKLSHLEFLNEAQFVEQWQVAEQHVQVQCGEVWNSKPKDVSFKDGKIYFSLNNFSYYLQKLNNGHQQKVSLFKTSGNLANKNLMSVVFRDGQKDFVHIVGRDGKEESTDRYDFVFSGLDSLLIHKSRQDFTDTSNIKSLKTIYGSVPTSPKPRIHVGVIGSGLDYNQPDMALLLKHRYEIEKDLQLTEVLRDNLQTKSYWSAQELIEEKNAYLEKMQSVGFPKWMDQVFGGLRPFDAVILDPTRPANGDHETRITSRIISRGDKSIQLHFARRILGPSDILDVETVIENFYKEGVRIVNMSFGSSCGEMPLEENQWRKVFATYTDMIFVVSAGNSGHNVDQMPQCPADFSKFNKNVISVTALGTSGRLASYNGVTVNFGRQIDVAVKADDLMVLAPFSPSGAWTLNSAGGTSVAAAEVSRILVEASLDGYVVDAQTVKSQLIKASVQHDYLVDVVGSAGEIDEMLFRGSLQKSQSLPKK